MGNTPSLMTLPNELLLEVASNLKRFRDLNSLVRTSCRFYTLLNTDLYRRVVAADDIVLDDIVRWVLNGYRLAPLTLLLDHGLSVNHTSSFGAYDPTKKAMSRLVCELSDEVRSVPLARLLIQRGVDLEAKDAIRSETMLSCATFYANGEIAALLLAHGADPKATNRWGNTPLHFASKYLNAEMVNLLIAHGAAVDARNWEDETPLLTAIASRNCSVISALLAHGADAGVHTKHGETSLHCAYWFRSQHHELAKSLLEHGAMVNATNTAGRTPLHWLLLNSPRKSALFMAKILLENGADVNAISNDGLSPLQCALSNARPGEAVVALLLEHGADTSVLNENQRQWLSQILAATE